MPTAEGVFPKVGNDPIYYSEVNRFAQNNVMSAGSFPGVSSGTAIQDIGSFVIGPGSIGNPSSIRGKVLINCPNANPEATRFFVLISGVNTNSTLEIGSAYFTQQSENFLLTHEAVVGSPFVGYNQATLRLMQGADFNGQFSSRISDATLQNINMASPIWVLFKVKATSNIIVQSYQYNFLRGTI